MATPPTVHRSGDAVPIVDRLTSVPDLAPGPGFAHAFTVTGKLAFVSGQVALDSDGQVVGPGDLAAQTAQALRNLHRILGALGADWPDVVRFAWYVLDASSVQVIRDVRDEFIRDSLGDKPNPASTLVQVSALFRPEFLVEVDAVVAVPGG
jgi:enamine deaminase RidA (YjgF/YER057c/UK114 family)